MYNPHSVFARIEPDGSANIRWKVDAPEVRSGLEKKLLPAIKVGLNNDWERAHSRGAGLGKEFGEGILYAPKEVNQELQNRGIERFIRELFEEKRESVILYLHTVTKAHPGTNRLKEIFYNINAAEGDRDWLLFEGLIEVENKTENPRVYVTDWKGYNDYSMFLKEKKRTPQNNVKDNG